MIAKAINSIFEAGYKRVIVPGFGAFIKRNTGETVFTDMLSEDDGVLIASLIGSGMNAAEARQAVERFIVSLRSELALKGRAYIAGIGILTKTAAGSYSLEADTQGEITSEPVEETFIHASDEQTQTTSVTPDVIVETIIEETVIPEPESVIESEEAAEDFIHPSFAKKARLRSALYGDSDAERETELHPAEAVQQNPESIREDKFQNMPAEEDDSVAKAETGKLKPEEPVDKEYSSNKREEKKPEEIHTVKSDFIAATENDEYEPYKPQINIRRPAKSKKRIDGVMIVAIIALIITVGIIVYGYFAERDINSLKGEEEVMIEMEQQAE